MTSPHTPKPSAGPDGYESVHSRGGTYGQDLTEQGVEDLLIGGSRRPFSGAFSAISNFVGGFGSAFGVIGNWLGGGILEPPPLYKSFTEEAFRVLEPIHSLADRALDRAIKSQEKAEDLTEQLTGTIDGDLAEAIENHSGAVGELARLSEEAVTSSDETQQKISEAVADMVQAREAMIEAGEDFSASVREADRLATEIGEASVEHETTVAEAQAAATRVEKAVIEYGAKVEAASTLLSDAESAKDDAEGAAKQVQDTLNSPEWTQAVADFAFFQSQLNEEQSEFNQGVTSALAALEMVQDETSEFNQKVASALQAQRDINSMQESFNEGVATALATQELINAEDGVFQEGVRAAIQALQAFEDNQSDLNQAMLLAHSAQEKVNDFNQIAWNTQAEYNQQNNEINRSQTEALMLHENQLVLMNAIRPRGWTFYTATTHNRDPWVSVRIHNPGILSTSYVEVTALGTWAGRIDVSISFYDQGVGSDSAVDQYDWVVTRGNARHRTIRWNSGAVHMGIKNVAVTIFPYWGNEKREFLLKPLFNTLTVGYGFHRAEAYVNDLEDNPIRWTNYQSAYFPGKEMIADAQTYVAEPESGSSYTLYDEGSVIPAGYWIRANSSDLVKFTEA